MHTFCLVFLKVCFRFRGIFGMMEDKGILDVDDDIQLFCLHYVFLPRVQAKLEQFKRQHNNHKLRTEGSATPRQLFARTTIANIHSTRRGITGQRVVEEQDGVDNMYGVEGAVDDGAETAAPVEGEEPTVVVPPVRCPLSPEQYQRLLEEVPAVDEDDPIGIITYREVVRFVARHVLA